MTFTFRTAVREGVGLLIGLAGGTGSGKTYSALELATGISGDKPFAVIDTEAGRALHYADRFKFDHGDLKPPFTPERYIEAIMAADRANYPAIIVDSMSHEHAGEGGLLDMQEDNLQRMAGNDAAKREACKIAAWVEPKREHRAMVNKLTQIRAHLILCFRAEEKIEIIREGGKMKVVPKKSRTGKDGWIPIAEKNLPYELTCSFLLLSDRPGVPEPIKLEEQHRHLFPSDKPITRETGRALAVWAAGGGGGGITAPPAGPAAPEISQPREDPALLLARAEIAAKGGAVELRTFWNKLTDAEANSLKPEIKRLKQIAKDSDESVSAA